MKSTIQHCEADLQTLTSLRIPTTLKSYLFQLLYTILPASTQHHYLISHCCHQTLATTRHHRAPGHHKPPLFGHQGQLTTIC